jgi:hypothetical protein
MPVARYFLFVGAALLALLYAASAFFPGAPSEPTIQSAADLPVIRIHSDRKWPERVVFDTRVQPMPAAPTVVAAKTDAVVVPPAPPAKFDDLAAKARVRDAFAQLLPDEPKQVASAEPKKPQPPPQPHKRKIAKASVGSPKNPVVGPPAILVAQQPRFGFFANNLW